MDVFEHTAVMESLSSVHPRWRGRWLADRGLDNSYYTTFRKPENTGLAEVGRWPWGPSWELCGRDSLLFLGSGSGVRILSITDSVHPRMLGQIVARGLVSQVAVRDSLLFVACGGWGAQVYSVSDPANPRELGSMDAVIGDLAVVDTFCYTLGGDSLKVYSIADPTRPARLGAVRDGGGVLVVSNGYAYSGGFSTMNVYDVRNPAAPTWVASRGGVYLALFSRDTMLFCTGTQPDYLAILNVSDPANLRQLSSIGGYGGLGVYADQHFAYLSCSYERNGIYVIDITDPRSPQVRGGYNPEGSDNYDPYVPTPLSFGYLASDYGGLVVLDLHDPSVPTEAWSGYKAEQAVDICVDGTRAYVADFASGMQILDVGDPGNPTTVGLFDTVGARQTYTAAARDSFAFVGISGIPGRRYFRVLDVTDPATPLPAAQESCASPPNDMVLRDTLVYAAAVSRFYVFNVARPREPRLVGSCVTQDGTYFGLAVQDSLAYLMSGRLQVINVARPASPVVVSSTALGGATGIAVRDTFAYIPNGWDSVRVYSVANPASPRWLSSAPCGVWPWDAALGESTLYVATSDGWGVDVYDVSNPGLPVRTGRASAPTDIRRLHYVGGLVYAAMWDAGVAIYETETTGIAEGRQACSDGIVGPRVAPNPSSRIAWLLGIAADARITLFDALGRESRVQVTRPQSGCAQLQLAGLSAGVYFAEAVDGPRSVVLRIVKR